MICSTIFMFFTPKPLELNSLIQPVKISHLGVFIVNEDYHWRYQYPSLFSHTKAKTQELHDLRPQFKVINTTNKLF